LVQYLESLIENSEKNPKPTYISFLFLKLPSLYIFFWGFYVQILGPFICLLGALKPLKTF